MGLGVCAGVKIRAAGAADACAAISIRNASYETDFVKPDLFVFARRVAVFNGQGQCLEADAVGGRRRGAGSRSSLEIPDGESAGGGRIRRAIRDQRSAAFGQPGRTFHHANQETIACERDPIRHRALPRGRSNTYETSYGPSPPKQRQFPQRANTPVSLSSRSIGVTRLSFSVIERVGSIFVGIRDGSGGNPSEGN